MSDKAEYVVIKDFAHFKVGQVVELAVPCPSAAQAHVKLYVEPEGLADVEAEDSDAVAALKQVYELATGNKAGKKGAKKLGEELVELITKSSEPEVEPELEPSTETETPAE